jgi:membrane protein
MFEKIKKGFLTVFDLLREAFGEWQKDNVSILAASLAYYTVFSLTPILIISIAIAGSIFGEETAKGEIMRQFQDLVGSRGAEVIQTTLSNANTPKLKNIASLISVVLLLIGASGVFAQLQHALNLVWNVKAKPGKGISQLIRKRLFSFSMVLAIGFLLLVSLVVNAVLSALSNYASSWLPGFDFLWQIFNFVLSFLITTFLFALLYKFVPDVKIGWKDVIMGAGITALLFAIGKFLLGMYLGRGTFGSAYGAAGSLVVLLAWVYYSSQIIMFGAEFTQVYALKFGSRIVPDKHGKMTRAW